jgi:hypothetical protein
MAEPRTSLHRWTGSIIILVILLNTQARLHTISGEKVSFLIDQLSKKDYRKAAASGQPKAIVDGEVEYAE